ncbi:unnamed protein product [Staurois parvus]|uniref:Uncharacterized protein n=1 Tax=Staurois parvus TaxID=386267 RepID=A0ABN9CTS4_9NEOB|nr:unnamed protein product [Staurois parvus]
MGTEDVTDPGTQHRDGGNPSKWAQQVYRTRNSAQRWWEPLIMSTAGIQTWDLSTGMVGTPHGGHIRCEVPGTQHRDNGNHSG